MFKTITLFAKVLVPFGALVVRAGPVGAQARGPVATGGAYSIDENEAKVAAGALFDKVEWTRMARWMKRSSGMPYQNAIPRSGKRPE